MTDERSCRSSLFSRDRFFDRSGETKRAVVIVIILPDHLPFILEFLITRLRDVRRGTVGIDGKFSAALIESRLKLNNNVDNVFRVPSFSLSLSFRAFREIVKIQPRANELSLGESRSYTPWPHLQRISSYSHARVAVYRKCFLPALHGACYTSCSLLRERGTF